MLEKLKSFLLNDQIFFAIIVVLVGIASFSLGRASVLQNIQKPPPVQASTQSAVTIERVKETTVPPQKEEVLMEKPVTGELVGSKSGTKYHLPTCPGAKQIKEENKVFFANTTEAQAAGYKPAANCPQLQ